MRSEGCEDAGKAPGCGKAYIIKDGKIVSQGRRGHNVATFDLKTGNLLKTTEYHF